MLLATFRLGLRHCPEKATNFIFTTTIPRSSVSSLFLARSISYTSRSSPQSLSTLPTSSKAASQSLRAIRVQIRHASAASQAIRANPAQSPSNTLLDWNSFFRLRTSRRRYSLVSSVLSAIIVTGGAFVFLSTQPELADEVTKLIPIDPIASMGLLTFAATLVGWLVGPVFGNGLWKLLHRARLPEFTLKERTFFERIKRHRVNPMGASTNNPVPDYYGEKIGSVSGYRRWLRDQRAFNRKREGSYPGGI